MALEIDQYGRVLIPKRIRETYGLEAGTKFRVEEHPDGISLIPLSVEKACTRDEAGVPIYRGRSGEDAVSLVRRSRGDRTDSLMRDG